MKHLAAAALLLIAAPAAAKTGAFDPVAFFTGASHGQGTLREVMSKAKHVSVDSVGRAEKDGRLILDQVVRVQEDPVKRRRWVLKQTGPNHWSGTLSDAKGPVTAQRVGTGFKIRYKMPDGIKVEQSLTPLGNGRGVDNRMTFRKFGLVVARMEERIAKR